MKYQNQKKTDIWEPQIDVSPDDVAGVERRNLANALFKAVVKCNFQRVRFLLETGVSTKIINDAGQNLLMAALYIPNESKRDKMFQLLARKGADPCHIDRNTGRDTLGWAAYLGRADQVAIILDAIVGEIDMLRHDKEGMTPLHYAVIGGHYRVVEILLEKLTRYGLNVDTRDTHGLTPYIYARRLAHKEIAQLLVERGKCSRHQLDTVTFRSADEWETIGKRERQKRDRERLFQAKRFNKRLSPIKSKHLPRISTALDSTSSTDSKHAAHRSAPSIAVSSSNTKDTDSTDGCSSSIQIPAFSLSSADVPEATVPPTYETIEHLIALSTPQRRPNSNEMEHLLLDSARIGQKPGHENKAAILDNIGCIMDMVAAQACHSFRSPVKPPTPPATPETGAQNERMGMAAISAAAMFGKAGKNNRQSTATPRKSLAAMTNMLSASSKVTDSFSDKRRKKAFPMAVA